MTRNAVRRWWLYSLGAAATLAFVYVGFIYREPPGIDSRLEVVFAAVRAKDVERARVELGRVADDFAGHVKVKLAYAWLDEYEGKIDDARAAYLALSDATPEPTQRRDLLLTVADLDRRVGKAPEAEAGLAAVVSEFGETERSRRLRIALLIDGGRLSEASSELGRLDEESPGNPYAAVLRRHLRRLEASKASNTQPGDDGSTDGR